MSERTGATDAQVEAMAKRQYEAAFRGRRAPEWENFGGQYTFLQIARSDAAALVPPGMVIAPVADVLTSDQRSAVRKALYALPCPPDWNGDLIDDDVRAVLRAIADGGAK